LTWPGHQFPPPIEARGGLKVLWLGNVTISKGIQYLVEAARLLQSDNIEFSWPVLSIFPVKPSGPFLRTSRF